MGAINGAKRVDIGPAGGPMKHIFHDFAVVPLSKLCFPPSAGSIFLKNNGYSVKKKGLKHDRHKENIISHTNFEKLKVRCIQSFLMTGLWRRKTHGSPATGCF